MLWLSHRLYYGTTGPTVSSFIHTISSRSYVDIYTSCFNGLSTCVCILGDTKGVPTKPMIRFRVSLSSVSVEDIGAVKYAGLPLSSTFPSRTTPLAVPIYLFSPSSNIEVLDGSSVSGVIWRCYYSSSSPQSLLPSTKG